MKIKVDVKFDDLYLPASGVAQILLSFVLIRNGLCLMHEGDIDFLRSSLKTQLDNERKRHYPHYWWLAYGDKSEIILMDLQRIGDVLLKGQDDFDIFPPQFPYLLLETNQPQAFQVISMRRGSYVAEFEELFKWVGRKFIEIVRSSYGSTNEKTFAELIKQAADENPSINREALAVGAAQVKIGQEIMMKAHKTLGTEHLQISAIGGDEEQMRAMTGSA